MKKIEKYILIDIDNKNIDIKGINDTEFLRSIYITLIYAVEFENLDLLEYEEFLNHLRNDLKKYKKIVGGK